MRLAPLAAALLATPALAAPVSAELAAAVAEDGTARVIVALGPRDGRRASPVEVAAIQERVLADVALPARRLRTVPGLVLDVDADGLAALASHAEVRAISLDSPAVAAMDDSLVVTGGFRMHGVGVTGAGVKVGVLDSGVDVTHPDLAGSVVDEHCICTNDCCPDGTDEQAGAGSAEDGADHGTPATGIIASNGTVAARGFVPEAEVVAVRVLDDEGIGTVGAVLAGLDWIALEHPDTDVVNVSIAGVDRFSSICDTSSAVAELAHDVVSNLEQGGTLTIVASGNNGVTDGMGIPACLSNTLTVGATYDVAFVEVKWTSCTDTAPEVDDIACITNAGSLLDLLAPGYKIDSSSVGGGTRGVGGTSYASPHATGVAAQLMALEPDLTPAEVWDRMISTGASVTDDRTGLTHPRVDAIAAAMLPDTELECDDGLDGDGDGSIDCDDSDCKSECPGLVSCSCSAGSSPAAVALFLAAVGFVRRRRR